jgi:AhpD family alkylhydroperoxidase
MEMNDTVRELIAIGASITANCQPCLESHVEKAFASGADLREVTEAIKIGNRVRKGAAARMDAVSVGVLSPGWAQGLEVVLSGNGRDFLGP